MDHLDQRHQLLLGVGPLPQVGDRPLLHAFGTPPDTRVARRSRRPRLVARLVARGDVHPGHRGQGPQQVVAARRPPTPASDADHLGELPDRLLAVAEHEGVDEVGQGLGVEGAVAAGHHQGVRRVAVRAAHRHPGQVDQVEHVGVGELGRQVEGQDVELARRHGCPRARTAGPTAARMAASMSVQGA